MSATRVPVRTVADRVLVTDDTAWAWFTVPTVSYEFLSTGERDALLASTTVALGGLSGAECQLLAFGQPYDATGWADALDGATSAAAPGWPGYLRHLREHLAGREHWQRRCCLGVALGRRSGASRGRRRAVGDDELAAWQAKAALLGRVLGSTGLRPEPLPADRIADLVARGFWRGLTAPPAPPPGAIDREWIEWATSVEVRHRYRSLELHAHGETSHLALLAAARFPDHLTHPGAEWLSLTEVLPFPVEVSARVRLVPPHEASQDAARKLAEASDQARHIAGTSSDLPLALLEATEQARQLEYAVTKQTLPLVYGLATFVVRAGSADELDARCGELVELYRDLGIVLVRPGGDQLSLFASAVPGDRARVRAYEQRQALVTLAGGMIQATSDLGDHAGCYIGETSGRSRAPVHYDPLSAAQRNLPTAVAITGQPGGGKTHLAKLLLYQLRQRGAWGLMVDPKDEADGLARLPGLGAVQVLDVGPGEEGVLDPFSLADDHRHGALLAADTLQLLVPGDLDAEHEAALLEACRLEAEAAQPTLGGVTDRLAGGPPAARRLAETIRTISFMPLARLCFPVGPPRPLLPDGQLTILQLSGLTVPDAGTPERDLTLADRLSVAVMYLVTVLAERLADASRAQAKAIVIDEAWALTASRQGRALVQRLARTGRSKNTALLLVSQNAADFLGSEVQNNFSARFAFRSTQDEEVTAICRLLGIEPTEAHRHAVRTLENGECVFADPDGRVGTVRVDLADPALATAFDTTPCAPTRPTGPRVGEAAP